MSTSVKRSFQDMNRTPVHSIQFRYCTYCRGTGNELCYICRGSAIDPETGWKCMCRDGQGYNHCGICSGTGKNPSYRENKKQNTMDA